VKMRKSLRVARTSFLLRTLKQEHFGKKNSSLLN